MVLCWEVRRTIVDLSWPENFSVNVGVQKNTYLGSSFVLNYPSVDDIVKKIIELGPGSLLYRVDISRAFRQLKGAPGIFWVLSISPTSSTNRYHLGTDKVQFSLEKSPIA